MASPFSIPVTAAQVGTYFVGQYYQVLQQTPDRIHEFYSNNSSMIRIDGSIRDTASAMLQIHTLVTALNYSAVEIKTAHSLESWNGGVLVMVSGSVQLKDFNRRRKFVETFFLAPQETGYFILNDIFHYVDEDQLLHHPAVYLAQSNLDPANYLHSGEVQARECMSTNVKVNSQLENYGFPEERLKQVHDSENGSVLQQVLGQVGSYGFPEEPAEVNDSHRLGVESVHEHQPTFVDESVGEPQKHTYAYILRVAKEQPVLSATSQPQASRNVLPSSEWNHSLEPTTSTNERSGTGTMMQDYSAIEEEDEIRSVYVKNVSSSLTESEIEEEFKKFGKISPEGVVIRSRKDVGVYYAFVEYEDMTGVHNAIEAGSVQIAGRPVYIEERRPNSYIPSRGGRGRGRGRGSYQTDAPKGRFVSRGYGQNGSDRDYNTKARGNGYYKPRQE